MSGITIALISGGCSVLVGGLSLIGVIVSNNKANIETQHKLETAQAVTDTKIEALTREVREHNNFAKRVPVLEEKIKSVEKALSTQ